MARITPSRAAIRYLQRLCATDSPHVAATRAPRSCAVAFPQSRSPAQSRRKFTASCNLAHSTSTALGSENSPPRQDDASNLPTTLPDISTFYTIFPQTLPNGPPTGTTTNPATFSISLSSLRREFLQLQSKFHPDKYPTSSSAHSKAVALSSLINNAYRTLSDPLLRAQYLLDQLHNIDVMSEDNSSYPTDQTTLMEVMDAQESVEEAQSQEEVDRLKDENSARIDATVRRLGEAFEKGEKDAATQECVRLKYWRSLQQGLNDWEPGKEVRLIH